MTHYPVLENQAEESFDAAPVRDPLYLVACQLLWQNEGNLSAFQELLSALEDPDHGVRLVAESLLRRGTAVTDTYR
jgi:hypothetical protein